MKKKIFSLFVLILLFGALFTVNCFANTQSDSEVKPFVDSVADGFDNITKKNKDNKTKKQKEIKSYIGKIADLDWIGNFVLGKNKKIVNSSQKKKFIDVFSQYLIGNYFELFSSLNRDNYKFLSSENKGNVYFVYTTVKYNDTNSKVDFRIVKKDNNFYITDIIIEGISFIATQRSDVDSRITAVGFDNFLKELKTKNNNLK